MEGVPHQLGSQQANRFLPPPACPRHFLPVFLPVTSPPVSISGLRPTAQPANQRASQKERSSEKPHRSRPKWMPHSAHASHAPHIVNPRAALLFQHANLPTGIPPRLCDGLIPHPPSRATLEFPADSRYLPDKTACLRFNGPRRNGNGDRCLRFHGSMALSSACSTMTMHRRTSMPCTANRS